MILLIIIWLFLGFACYLYGCWALNLLEIQLFEHPAFEEYRESGAIITTWVGVLFLSSLLLLISLISPLSLKVFSILNIFLIIISLSTRSVRFSLIFYSKAFSFLSVIGWISLLLIIAFIATANVTLYDSGLYHFQLTQWLSKWGTVPGLALLHDRFGFTSVWFALAAPFNTGFLETRIVALNGGFAIFLAFAHVATSLNNLIQKHSKYSTDRCNPDYFLIVATFLSLPYLINATLAISSSPDTPVIILTVELAWLILVLSNFASKNIDFELKSKLKRKTENLYFLPLILSAGAMTIKFSALPLVLTSLLFYSLQSRFSFSLIRFLKGVAIAGLVLFPVVIANLTTSGCPLYPSPLLCLHLPWSIAPEDASHVSKIIQDWARWWRPTPDYANHLNWILPWLRLRKEAVFLLIASLVFSCLLLLIPRYRKLPSIEYLLILVLIGIAFMLYKAPDVRFGLGYLIVTPSFAIALILQAQTIWGKFLFLGLSLSFYFLYFLHFNLDNLSLIFITFIVLLYLVIWISYFFRSGQIMILKILLPALFLVISTFPTMPYLLTSNSSVTRILLPPKMQSLTQSELLFKEAENFDYYLPKIGDRCFASPLPCTPYLTYDNVQLRDKLTFSKGFKKKNNK